MLSRKAARVFEAALLPLGAGALALLVSRVLDARELRDLATAVGPWFALVLAQELVPVAANTGGLLACFPHDWGRIGLRRGLAARLAGEGVNATMPTATVGGELLKVSLLARRAPPERAAAGVTAAYAAQALAQMLFTALTLPVAVAHLDWSWPLRLLLGVFVAGGVLAMWGFAAFARGGAFGWLHRILRRIGVATEGSSAHAATARIDEAARAARDQAPRAFELSVGFFLLAWFWGAAEVRLVAWLCGVPVDFAACLAIESLSVFIDAVFFFVPGQLGVREGGLAGITMALGLGPEAGVAIGLVRRARQLTWAGLGLLCLAWFRLVDTAPLSSPEPSPEALGSTSLS